MTRLGIDLDVDGGRWVAEFGQDAIAYDLMPQGALPTIERVGCLPGGMASGAPAFEVAVRLPDGRVVFAETSWRMMHAAVRALEQRWPVEG